MAIAIAVILLVIGSVLFHFLSPWYFTPLASNWDTIDLTVDITFWVTGVVFVAINLFMAYAIIRYRHRKGLKADYEPENKKLEWWLTAITTVGVVAMLAPGLVVWAEFVTVPEDAGEFEAMGQQWHWSFRFPGEDGVMGQSAVRLMTVENPFGLDPEDKNSLDDVLVFGNEVHLPINKPMKALLRSTDVLHDFAVPQFRVKMDLVPGLVTYLWFEPTKIGRFDLLCEELCGLAHHTMRGDVVIEEQADFDLWLAAQPTFADTLAIPVADASVGQALYAPCAACHGMQGEGNLALNAPKLSGQEGWYLRRQLNNYKTGRRGTDPADMFGAQMAAMAGTLPDAAAINNVIAYIQSLPDVPAVATISGDVSRGEDLYTTCAACHGRDAMGIWSVSAPRQAGMSDWYLANQLRNFKSGLRGTHPQDGYGEQMASMSMMLLDDAAINDVIAYINTLPVEKTQQVATLEQ
ncbi:MAG: c-type cytochrome [Gammaproteobacteria bacterium]